MTTDDHTQPCDCHQQTLAKLDRILELLEDRRKPTVQQQVDDLIQRYEQGTLSGPDLYKRVVDAGRSRHLEPPEDE